MTPSHRSGIAALAFSLALAACGAQAATFCVSNTAELATALNQAANNDSDDVILLRQGSYDATLLNSLQGFYVNLHDGRGLTLDGGWMPFNQIACGIRVAGAELTRLEGGNDKRPLRIIARGSGNILVSNLAFVDGRPSLGDGGGLSIDTDSEHSGRILVQQNVFRDNRAARGGGLEVTAAKGAVLIRNNLFANNDGLYTAGALQVYAANPATLHIVNNSFVGNAHLDGSGSGNRSLQKQGTAKLHLINNVFWGNQGANNRDFNAFGYDVVLHNNLQFPAIPTGPEIAGNISLPPAFVASLDWRLKPESPMRNAGYNADAELLGTRDLDGRKRRLGRAVDIGAYEFDDLLADGFE
jgi:hypothetical protein